MKKAFSILTAYVKLDKRFSSNTQINTNIISKSLTDSSGSGSRYNLLFSFSSILFLNK